MIVTIRLATRGVPNSGAILTIGIHFFQCRFQVAQQGGKGPPDRSPATDDNKIVVPARMFANYQVGGGAQPAADSVAAHRVADLAADRQPDPGAGFAGFGPPSPSNLQYQAIRHPFSPGGGDTQKFRSFFQSRYPGGHERAAIRPTGVCGPWRGGWPESGDHRPRTCGCGNRDDVLGPVDWVERYASKDSLRRYNRPRCIRSGPG